MSSTQFKNLLQGEAKSIGAKEAHLGVRRRRGDAHGGGADPGAVARRVGEAGQV